MGRKVTANLDDHRNGRMVVVPIRKTSRSPILGYQVRLRGIIVDVIRTENRWGCLPPRAEKTDRQDLHPQPPFGNLHDTLAEAGGTLKIVATL